MYCSRDHGLTVWYTEFMTADTRTELLAVAARQFADKGFYGTSIAAIADELGLTKQALIHHFGTKQRLYGEVLQRISDRLLSRIIQIGTDARDPETQLEALLVSFFDEAEVNSEDLRLLMRELLDNERRAAEAASWYLKPFLDALIAMVKRAPGWERASDMQALALIYQFLGAVNYFAISAPTLTQMFGKRAYRDISDEYPGRLRTMVRAGLASPPS